MNFPFLDWAAPIPFAHRGGASEAPENTMPAFEHAVGLGYRYVETDVHVTADGVLVAFHDDILDRVTDRQGVIGDLPWSDVARAKVDGREPIPLLADLLTAWPDVRVNIDPKHDAAVAALVAVLREHRAVDRVCLGAFSDERLERLRAELGPAVCTSLGPLGVAQLVGVAQGTAGDPPDGWGAACVQVPPSFGEADLVTAGFVSAAHERALPVHVWTIDEPDEMEHLLDLGVDGIMTDRPVVLRDVLEARGEWLS